MTDKSTSRPVLDVAVVGVGAFGTEHARLYAQRDDCRLVAVVDPDRGRAEQLAAELAIPAVLASVDGLLELEIDAASIANPGSAHVRTAEELLVRDIPVLLEKPVALTSVEGQRLLKAESRSQAFVMPGHILRFSRPYQELRAALRGGAVGAPLAMVLRKHRTVDHDRRYPSEHPVMLTGIHDIDLVLWLVEGPVVDVRSREIRTPGRNQPSVVTSELVTGAGVVITLVNTWTVPEGGAIPDSVEIYGTSGTLALDLVSRVRPNHVDGLDDELVPATGGGALSVEIDHFLACVRAGEPSAIITLREAVEAIALAERIIHAGAAV